MQTINICSVLDVLFPNNAWYGGDWKVIDAAVTQWCVENNAYHYARGREEFSRYEATRLAEEAGCTVVLLHDLS
jgi:hypothetical protein